MKFSIQVPRQLSFRLFLRRYFHYISRAQSFERDQFRIDRLSLCWDLGMLRQKPHDLVIENVPWRDFIEVRMLGTMSEQSELCLKSRTITMGESRGTSIEPNVSNTCQTRGSRFIDRAKGKQFGSGSWLILFLPIFTSVLFLATYLHIVGQEVNIEYRN